MGKAIRDLAPQARSMNHFAHLDPDLSANARLREHGWRPMFGQSNAAEAHLRANGVGPGDLMLFFGWFRQTELKAGKLRYTPGSPNIHLLFGWFQIDFRQPSQISSELPSWAQDHPHCRPKPYSRTDSIYVASPALSIARLGLQAAGAGAFGKYHPARQLTAKGHTRSLWRLPSWFLAPGETPRLTYHTHRTRWRRIGDFVTLNVVGRGQEFVLHEPSTFGLSEWLRSLLTCEDAND